MQRLHVGSVADVVGESSWPKLSQLAQVAQHVQRCWAELDLLQIAFRILEARKGRVLGRNEVPLTRDQRIGRFVWSAGHLLAQDPLLDGCQSIDLELSIVG